MMKLGFPFFFSKPYDLWVQVLRTKYFNEGVDHFRVRNINSKFVVWREMMPAWPHMTAGLRSGLRNGQGDMFWTQHLVDSGSRLVYFILPDTLEPNLDATIAEFCTPSSEWNYTCLRFCLQRLWCLKLQVSPLRWCIEATSLLLGDQRKMSASASAPPMSFSKMVQQETGKLIGPWCGVGMVPTALGTCCGSWLKTDSLETRNGASGT
ncbi:hypothetical protein LINPERHAP1_LOCUS28621 [Linum perenne]